MIQRILNVVVALFLVTGAVVAWAADNSEFATQPDVSTAENDDSVQSTEQARRLTRAWAEHEARRAETARKLDEEQARDREIARLRSAVSGLGRRESFLRHEVYWSQRELDAISRDPADTSAMARRGNVDRELNDLRNQLDLTLTPRQATMRQLDGLRLR
jgi:chromosome segregation ATPase